MNSPEHKSGAWIFVSHSHRDLEKVRQIRNELEKRGHNPLLFFLKCLEDDDARLPELIREEIKAREWFILCDSPHAKNSGWVQQEIELIKGMEGKVFEMIDLSKNLQAELHKIVRLTKRATVFLSYASADRAVADAIRRALLAHEFTVTMPEDFSPSAQPFQAVVSKAIDDAVARGFVLVLLSSASLRSKFVAAEIEYGLSRARQNPRSNIIPVVIEAFPPGSIPPAIEFQLANIQRFDLTTGRFGERVEELIQSLKTREME